MKAIHVETDKGHWVRGGVYTTNLFLPNEEHMHLAGWKPALIERISPASVLKKIYASFTFLLYVWDFSQMGMDEFRGISGVYSVN